MSITADEKKEIFILLTAETKGRSKEQIKELIDKGHVVELTRKEVELFLPHRRKALKIDGVRFSQEYPGKITGLKTILNDDPDLDGHFDGRPIYPGNCLAECANLAAAMMVILTNENISGYPTVADFQCTCKRPVIPGSTVEINVVLLEQRSHHGAIFYSFTYDVKMTLPNGITKTAAIGKILGTST